MGADRMRVQHVRDMANTDFLRRYAKPGRIGLMGGTAPVDMGIRYAQRNLILQEKRNSLWSHVVLFQGDRIDGEPWMIECDFEVGKGQFRNGVQENRVDKYGSEKLYPNLAVLDFDLKEDEIRKVLVAGLDLVARKTNYAVGGLLKTYWAILSKKLEKEQQRDDKVCSSLIRTLFEGIGIDLAPGVAVQHTTPEHVAQTPVPHARYILIRHGA